MAHVDPQTPTFLQFFRVVTGKAPFPYQRRLAEDGLPDVLLAPTGAGKTAAAILAWWWRRRFHRDAKVRASEPRRLVYCLPMRVLVEQTAKNVGTWAANCAREYGSPPALVRLMGGDVDDAWMNDPVSDMIIVGTQDMLLSRALNRGYAQSRYAWPRAFGLLNNDTVWIIDETQLFGVGLATTTQLAGLRRKLGAFGPTRTMWMSATLKEDELTTVDFPQPKTIIRLNDDDFHDPELRRRRIARKVVEHIPAAQVDVADADWTKKLAERLATRVREGGCTGNLTLVVVNRVRSAVEIHAHLQANLQGGRGKNALAAVESPPDLVLLHSRFRSHDRKALVERLLADPPATGRIVVSTQVVEAGVDVSAHLLVTQSAPWSSMVQRFGRGNRFGVDDSARIWWFGAKASSSDKWAAPYEAEDVRRAEKELKDLEGHTASPEALSKIEVLREPQLRSCLRRTDLIDLFDTTSDLTGGDLDVGRFIRENDDRDAQVYWRDFETADKGGRPPSDLASPWRDELCAVGLSDLRDFPEASSKAATQKRGWIWDYLDAKWRPATKDDVRPGAVLLFHTNAGGYVPERGFDARSKAAVPPVPPHDSKIGSASSAESSPRSDDSEVSGDDDPRSFGVPVALSRHAADVAAEADVLAVALAPHLDARLRVVLRSSGRFHDLGKAHPAFQAFLRSADGGETDSDAGVLLAKSGAGSGGLHPRRYFRHELASALVVARLRPAELNLADDHERDLCAFLVACHHGKVRLAIRPWPDEPPPIGARDEARRFGAAPYFGQLFALGVWQGDTLPEVDLGDGVTVPPTTLDLSLSRLGVGDDGAPSWTDRVLRLRDATDDASVAVAGSAPRLGPFRLGFLEAVIRAADVRATITERAECRRGTEILR